MKAKTTLIFLLSGMIACGLGFAQTTGAQEYQWRIALEEIQGSMQHEYARKFVALLADQSGGKIDGKIRFYGELGTSGDITELLQKGDIQFAFQSPGHLGSYIPQVQVFSIHYLFPTEYGLLEKVLRKGPHTYKALGKHYRQNRLELLSIIQEGWQIWTANKPLRKPADFEDVTFRVMSSPFLITAYRLYGAYVMTAPYGEIYMNLELGRIDAQTQPFFAIWEMKFHEVQNYMIKANQLPFIGTFAANYKFMQGLPENIRAMIDAAVQGANEYIFDFEPKLNAKRKQMILKDKPSMTYIELTDDEIAAFKQKARPLRQKYVEMGGQGAAEILQAVDKDIEWAKSH